MALQARACGRQKTNNRDVKYDAAHAPVYTSDTALSRNRTYVTLPASKAPAERAAETANEKNKHKGVGAYTPIHRRVQRKPRQGVESNSRRKTWRDLRRAWQHVASDFGHDPFTWLIECAQTAKYALECARGFHALVRIASSSAILCRRRRRLISNAGFAPPGCRTPFVDSVPDCAVAPKP